MHFISIWKKMDYWRDKMVSNQKYKPFNVGDIFFITNGKGITRQEIKDHPGELAAIQSAATNNGIMGFIDEDYCRERLLFRSGWLPFRGMLYQIRSQQHLLLGR